MDRRNVTGHDGTVHEGLFNTHTGFLIDLTCDENRYAVVRHYEKLDPARLTDAPLTCAGCTAAAGGDAPHPADLARACADVVLAYADRRGHVPPLDNEALRLAFVRIASDDGELRPVFERLARGVYDPENNYRVEPLYPLIREHLTDDLTARALTVPEGTPEVLIRYTRWTGGSVQVPIGVGDRLVWDGLASGHWDRFTVLVVEHGGIIAQSDDGWRNHFSKDDVRRFFAYKTDRAPQPAAV
ncbi:hypothetical protein ACH4F6_38075 [Streptomyces sp. NPDC017936]|uniref:hypothetical protein n=1 Tax=Streptomyces sp. NPDC017936 TaxID=3365016 RepID=UPI0037AF4406